MKPKKPKVNEEHLRLFLKALPYGKKNALTIKVIKSRTGLPDETITNFNHRAIARELNARGIPVVSCPKGFYLTDKAEDLHEYADRDLLRRAWAIMGRRKDIKRIAKRFEESKSCLT